MKPPKCDKCRSDDIYVKSIFYWSEKQSVWLREAFCDEVFCSQCGNECVDVPEKYQKAGLKI